MCTVKIHKSETTEMKLFGDGLLVSLMIIDSLQYENRKACSDFPFLMPTKTVLQI